MRTSSLEPFVRSETMQYAAMKRQLLSELPMIDDETLADTLEGITAFREMLAEVVRSALDDQALAKGLSSRLDDMKARIERFEARASRKRQLVRAAMEQADLQKLAESDFTASLRKSPPSVDVFDEAKIPAAFWKPQPPKLDRQAILVAFKNGAVVEGATLSETAWQLSVRTK
jgi:hypothetical protein